MSSFGLGLDVSAQVGNLSEKIGGIETQLRFMQKYDQVMRGHPARVQSVLVPQATLSASAPTVIGDPPGGMVWQVQRVTFGLPQMVDASSITTQGTIIMYSGGIEIARTTTVPNFFVSKDYTFFVTPNEYMTAVWVGGAITGTNGLIVDVAALEYPVHAPTEIDV